MKRSPAFLSHSLPVFRFPPHSLPCTKKCCSQDLIHECAAAIGCLQQLLGCADEVPHCGLITCPSRGLSEDENSVGHYVSRILSHLLHSLLLSSTFHLSYSRILFSFFFNYHHHHVKFKYSLHFLFLYILQPRDYGHYSALLIQNILHTKSNRI